MPALVNLFNIFSHVVLHWQVQDLQVDKQHGTDHHDEAAKRWVEVHDAEQDAGAGHCVQPVQPITVQLVII